MSLRQSKIAIALLAAATIVGTVGEASAERDRYTHMRSGTYRQGYYAGRGYHRGVPGAVVGGVLAGAALGLAGATGGSYNGYPAYGYGPGYGGAYGYDYHPGHGYYGPY